MTISEPRLRTLLRQAEKVAASGKRQAAETLYRQILEEAPESADAWLGLAAVLSDKVESEAAYKRVLQIDPVNEAAQAGLAALRGDVTTVAKDDGTAPDPFTQSREWLDAATARRKPGDEAAEPESTPEVETAVSDAPTTIPADGQGQPTSADHAHAHVEEAESYDLVCYRHPDRETSLRCYTCGRPICSQCAVKTPVGYRCPTCVREAESVFYNAKPLDYVIAPLVAFFPSLLAGYLVTRLGGGFFFILIILFVGGAIGGLIGRLAKRTVGRRRGRYLPHAVAAMVALGVILPAAPILLFILLGNAGALTALLMPGIFLFVATSAAFYQMK